MSDIPDAEFEEVPDGDRRSFRDTKDARFQATDEEERERLRRARVDGGADLRYDPHQPTDENRKWVATMVAAGISSRSIALCLDISYDSLRRHYKRELETALDVANARVAGKLFERCMQGDVAAMTFWLKTRARWKTADRLELSGPEGGPVQTQEIPAVLGKMSDEQRRLLRELAGSISRESGGGEGDS